jgi:hypothetical protein
LGTAGSPVRPVHQHRLPLGALGRLAQVGGGEELAGHEPADALVERHQERQVGVALHVVDEERNPPLDEELAQDDVTHRHRERAVGARLGRQPGVGELGVVGVVGGDDDDLLALVAGFGHPMCVRGARHRDVGSPHQQVGGVPPVAGLRDVGLVPEHLR